MKIKALTSAAGNTYMIAAGEEIDLPDEIANDLIKAGFAILLIDENGDDNIKRPGRPKK